MWAPNTPAEGMVNGIIYLAFIIIITSIIAESICAKRSNIKKLQGKSK